MRRKRAGAAVPASSLEDADAVIICGPGLTVLDADEGALRYLGAGLSRRGVVGRGLADLMAGRERLERYAGVLRTGRRSTTEESLVLPGGQEAQVVTRAVRAGDRLVILISDVTARKRAEARLRASESKYRLAVESASDVIWISDVNLSTAYVSPSLGRALGRAPGRSTVRDLAAQMAPGSVARLEAAVGEYLAQEGGPGADRDRTIRLELEHRRRDGAAIWMENLITCLRDAGGKAAGFHGVARDITAQKEAADALAASEARYRQLFDLAVSGMALLEETTGRVVLGNDAMAGMFGFSSGAEMGGVNALEFVREEDRESVARQMAELISDPARRRTVTMRVRTRDARDLTVTGSGTPVEHDGRHAVLISVMDTTAAAEAERKLQESEEKYRDLFEHTLLGMEVVDAGTGRVVLANRSIARIFGAGSAEDVVGLDPLEYVLPEDRQWVATDMARLLSEPAWDKVAVIRFRGLDGRLRWAAAMTTPFQYEGRAAMLVSLVDVTERKEMEEQILKARAELEARVEQRTAELREANRLLIDEVRQRQQAQKRLLESESQYRELVENANSIIMELDTRGRVAFFNRFAEEFYGFKEAEIIGRRVVGTIAPPVDSAGRDLKAEIKSILKHPEDRFVVEYEGMRRNGERVWISWTNKGLYDAEGRLRKVLCIGMDRTEQRRVADLLAEQLKEKAAADERQRLARDLHDAVTQTLFSTSLIAEILPRLWRKDRGEAERRLAELRRLTRGALSEMRMLLLELRPGGLGEVGLAELLRHLVEAAMAQSGIRLDLSFQGQCTAPAEVQVVLYRVAQEALNNVVRHSGATGAEVRLNCRPGEAKLVVSDNGTGFDPREVSPKSLGLRIMQERVQAVGAALKVEPRKGGGTRVTAAWSDGRRKGSP